MSNRNNRMIVFASLVGAILATSMLALNPSMIANAGAQMYGDQYGYDSNYYQDDNRYGYDSNYYQDDNRYGYDNDHQKKSSHVDIQKIKCVNSNINVNGVDITEIPQDASGLAAANEAGEGPDGANTQYGNGLGDRINFDRNLVNICVNVNDNEQVKVPTDEEPEPPESRANGTLTVTKFVTCERGDGEGSTSSTDPCPDLLSNITASDFQISIAGFQPVDPTSFEASGPPGDDVLLGVGPYAVIETPDASVATNVTTLEAENNVVIDGPNPEFDEDCTQSAINDFVGLGTMAEGDSQTCEITNNFLWFSGDVEAIDWCHCPQGNDPTPNCNTITENPAILEQQGHFDHQQDHPGECTDEEENP